MHETFPHYPDLRYLDMMYAQAHVNRYHMCRTTRLQYLSEHAHRVACIFRVLLREWSTSFHYDLGTNVDRIELYGLRMALDHDALETLTGDMPSHSKNPVIKAELKKIEAGVLNMVQDAQAYMAHHLTESGEPWEVVARTLLKLADIAEGLVFAYYCEGLGHTAPDAKWKWVNDNWARIATRYINELSADNFTPSFKAWAQDFIVNARLGVCPQHA